jgi:hypothetical protein
MDGETPIVDNLICRVCGATLEPAGIGRPPRYCSITCRRSAEYELKRTNRHLERVEWEIEGCRQQLDGRQPMYRRRNHVEQELAGWEADAERYRAVIQRLLA